MEVLTIIMNCPFYLNLYRNTPQTHPEMYPTIDPEFIQANNQGQLSYMHEVKASNNLLSITYFLELILDAFSSKLNPDKV